MAMWYYRIICFLRPGMPPDTKVDRGNAGMSQNATPPIGLLRLWLWVAMTLYTQFFMAMWVAPSFGQSRYAFLRFSSEWDGAGSQGPTAPPYVVVIQIMLVKQ